MSVKTKEEKKAHMRLCVGCGISHPKSEMLRIVRDLNGEVKLDGTGNADGRGVYVCPNIVCFEKAVKKNGLTRSLKINTLSPQLKDKIIALIGDTLKDKNE